MKTYIVYLDESGDDGVIGSSEQFILTSVYMPTEEWQSNYNKIAALRKRLKEKYGFHSTEEMHTKHFLTNKEPYRKYNWSDDDKREILKAFTSTIAELISSNGSIDYSVDGSEIDVQVVKVDAGSWDE